MIDPQNIYYYYYYYYFIIIITIIIIIIIIIIITKTYYAYSVINKISKPQKWIGGAVSSLVN